MKFLIAAFLFVTSLSAFAKDYSCEATLKIADKVLKKKLEHVVDNVSSAKIKYFTFYSIETNDSTLMISIVNQKGKIYMHTSATVFIPTNGVSSDLQVQLSNGYADINCTEN